MPDIAWSDGRWTHPPAASIEQDGDLLVTAVELSATGAAPVSAPPAIRDIALEAVKWVRASGVKTPTGMVWPANPADPKTVNAGLYAGTPGVVLFLLEAHRADVRAQKEKAGVPVVRFASLEEPLNTSPELVKTRWSRDGGREVEEGEAAAERRRERRRNVVFRPRFDPEGTKRLCGEAMAELVL